jgi:hypothetical protein
LDEKEVIDDATNNLFASVILGIAGGGALAVGCYFLAFLFLELTGPGGLTTSELVFWGLPGVIVFIVGVGFAIISFRKFKEYREHSSENAGSESGKV